jgi:hypothetical protein
MGEEEVDEYMYALKYRSTCDELFFDLSLDVTHHVSESGISKFWKDEPLFIRVSQNQELAEHDRLSTPIEQSPTIDWEAVKQRLHVCVQDHECGNHVPDPAYLPGFRIIDCTTRKIIPMQLGSRFTALSYVWGPETLTDMASSLPKPAYPLVEDAISCTLAIGIRYLWIDRYCIDQTSSQKHKQIQNMDHIYTGATVTIINAAGSGTNCRLPGVSVEACRKTLPSIVTVRGYTFQLLPNSRKEVSESKWATRAWTYQEGYLARRRLVFTRTHIYLQCSKSLYGDYTLACGLNDNISEARQYDWLPPVLASRDYRDLDRFAKSDAMISEYLRRELSYEADRLNAVMGIFRTLGHHIWGVLFESDMSASRLATVPRSTTPSDRNRLLYHFFNGLLWSPEQWTERDPVVRRQHDFPSWSWTGWRHLKKIHYPRVAVGGIDVDVRFKDDTQRELTIEQCAVEMDHGFDMYRFQSCLYMTGWLTHVKLLPLYPSEKNPELVTESFLPVEVVVTDWDGCSTSSGSWANGTLMVQSLLAAGFTSLEAISSKNWPVFIFGEGHPSWEIEYRKPSPGLLVLMPMGGTRYERLGSLQFARYEATIWPVHSEGVVVGQVEKGTCLIKWRRVFQRGKRKELRLPCERRSIELV